MSRNTLIVGNWKMHQVTSEAIQLVTKLKSHIKASPSIEIVVAPPFTALNSVEIALQESDISLAAQNMYCENQGAFTGEISVSMLCDVGCKYVILGHSERRHIFQESDEVIHKKLIATIHKEITPIFCIGETLEQRNNNEAFLIVEKQLKYGFDNIDAREISNFVLAYEPVWAIGTGETASPAQAQEMHQHIRNIVSKVCDQPTANAIRILYGGSVKPTNCKDLLAQADIDGLLVGGASLTSEEFTKIIHQANGK